VFESAEKWLLEDADCDDPYDDDDAMACPVHLSTFEAAST
jgi:hypothetical protein